jgi:phosphoribosylaminoimidazolecarboxamide formyltransferase/IMP cyclohydrolase
MDQRTIKRALISVYHKDGIDKIATRLAELGAELLSTGGTYDYIKSIGLPVKSVEEVTGYPSILGGRVKTLHPKVFGGILNRRELESDNRQIEEYEIPAIDLVIVDLYPFEKYVSSHSSHEEIIEKIDIGGISLIRAAAKNYRDVLIVPSMEHYGELMGILERGAESSLNERRRFAAYAFAQSSGYDSAIFNYFNREEKIETFRKSFSNSQRLRYGENPHQNARFYGEENSLPKQLWGKEISYNNLLDIEAAIELIGDFDRPTVAILKHNNACGCATRNSVTEAWEAALACDPVSAFGGVIISNAEIDKGSAEGMNTIFFEVVIAPSYTEEALIILKEKKNRIILINDKDLRTNHKFRSLLGGALVQERDAEVKEASEHKVVTTALPGAELLRDLTFANKLVKHSKSNAIVLAANETLLASGVGQTSRVDALKQAILKAESFGFKLEGAVMASDAFFPFPDCVEIADKAGIKAVIQPGGSVRDQESIDYCNSRSIPMITTGIRHFKH